MEIFPPHVRQRGMIGVMLAAVIATLGSPSSRRSRWQVGAARFPRHSRPSIIRPPSRSCNPWARARGLWKRRRFISRTETSRLIF